MIGDKVTRTVCGLWIVEGVDPLNTTNFSWTTDVIDEPGDAENLIAEEFVRQELMRQVAESMVGETWTMPDGVWFGPQHDGEVPREQYFLRDEGAEVLELTNPMVPDYLVGREDMVGPDDLRSFTVCGRFLNSGDKVCWSTMASNPLMAYFVVWDQMQRRTGDHMLLCGVHPGDVPAV